MSSELTHNGTLEELNLEGLAKSQLEFVYRSTLDNIGRLPEVLEREFNVHVVILKEPRSNNYKVYVAPSLPGHTMGRELFSEIQGFLKGYYRKR